MSSWVNAVEFLIEVAAEGLVLVNLLTVSVEHVPSETVESSELENKIKLWKTSIN